MLPDPYTWSAHPEASAGVLLLAAGYVVGWRAFRAEWWRPVVFALACVLLLATAVTPLDSLSYHLLLVHLLQNVILAEWAPALAVLGLPPALAAKIGALPVVRQLVRAHVALPLWLVTYAAWHVPAAYDAALEHPDTLLHLEHLSYFVAGCALWWPVFQDSPRRLSSGARAGYVFAAFALASPLGLLLALVPTAAYDFYARGPGLWGLSPLSDQQLAGVTMAGEQAVVFFAVFAFFFLRFLAEQETSGAAPAEPGRSARIPPTS